MIGYYCMYPILQKPPYSWILETAINATLKGIWWDGILLYVSNFAQTSLFLYIRYGNRCNVKNRYDFAETPLFLDIGYSNRCNVKEGCDRILLYVSNFAETLLFLDIGYGNRNVKEGYDWILLYVSNFAETPYLWILDTVTDTIKRAMMGYYYMYTLLQKPPYFFDIGYGNRCNVKEGYDGILLFVSNFAETPFFGYWIW